ncbi:MAG: hypothetical protein F4X79_00170 [Acidobacteria bacterium]|nr:hypothetical protein [Acidobacteriota bacterium]
MQRRALARRLIVSRLRNDDREQRRDESGIALQTIIIVVVLLAIAGAVAAVLLTRAGTETDRLEGETDRWTDIANETGCNIADGVWNDVSNTCSAPGTAIHNSNTAHPATAADCHTTNEGNPGHAHTFDTGVDADNNGDYTDPGDRPPSCT